MLDRRSPDNEGCVDRAAPRKVSYFSVLVFMGILNTNAIPMVLIGVLTSRAPLVKIGRRLWLSVDAQ